MSIINNFILNSILDNDAYKFYIQQAIYHRYYNVDVIAKFYCRGNDLLGKYTKDIESQIKMMKYLKLNKDELNYLENTSFFKKNYLNWLKKFRFNPDLVHIYNKHGKLNIFISGPWREVVLWEVPLLSIISEIVHHYRSPNIKSIDAIIKLQNKLISFKNFSKNIDISHFKIIDFGTRRRFSRKIHFDIIEELKNNCPNFIGTSNYQLAKEKNLIPFGTQSHEWFQAHQQISPNLANSQKIALKIWLDEYYNKLSIALTDCITMDAFLRDFGIKFAKSYLGLRHDSGDPIQWGEKAILHYKRFNIDPISKTLVFSDGLDFDKALKIYCHFWPRINLIFGIGIKLICDISNIKPLNIVIKLIECNGGPVAKLSDSPGKIICNNKSFIKVLQKKFGIIPSN